ncbi:MAG: helix-turn-helix transcriptional regulator [Deltaproteobacteria bacterium]|nr:helix-turn-helix transcriptional regulator [Deltaproteobacteria bacterium]
MPPGVPAQMPTDQQQLGARLRAARTAASLSQAELAERVGLSVESISRAERGAITPTIWSLLRVADALGVEFDVLARGTRPSKARSARRPVVERLVRLLDGLDDDAVALLADAVRALRTHPSAGKGSRHRAPDQ